MTDLRQSPNYAKYMRSLGWIVENGMFIKKLWFTSIVKIQHPAKINLEPLKKYHPFLIKLEPRRNIESRILNLGFRKDNWPLIPSKTIILDLKKISMDSLPKDVRYEIRKTKKNNLTIEQSDNIELFYRILQETMKLGSWSIPIHKEVANLYKSFQPNNSALLISYCHPELVSGSLANASSNKLRDPDIRQDDIHVAGCLLVWYGNTAHYMYAANTKRGRELGAAYFTLWEAIKFCQKKKLKYLDLEGIYDDRYPGSTKNWQGFTAFKLQWGGKIVEYPGSYSKYF